MNLISDILDLSKVEAGVVDIHTERLDAAEVVKDVADALLPLATEKGIKLRVELPGDEVIVETDRDKLRQILINMVGNAVKFTDSGDVRVCLRRTNDSRLAFVVSDTGLGISDVDLERIFDVFQQAELREGDIPRGTGLGLAISRSLAILLGGEITVTSVEGESSEFTLWLPA